MSTQDKAMQLFRYLKELSSLRTTHNKDVDNYDHVLYFANVPPNCYCIARDADTNDDRNVWLKVTKPDLVSPPEVSDDLEPWLNEDEVSQSYLKEVTLRDEIKVTIDSDAATETSEREKETRLLDDHPYIFDAWLQYMEDEWKPWAKEDQKRESVQNAYNTLFSIYQQAEKLGEQYEVVIGLGTLRWQSPNSGEIHHPLLTLQARVEFDGERGIMTVAPAPNGLSAKLELNMLEVEDRPGVEDQRKIAADVEGLNTGLSSSENLEASLWDSVIFE